MRARDVVGAQDRLDGVAREVGGDHGEGVGVHDRPDLGPQLQNDVLTHAYGDIFLMGGAASIAGMLLAFFLPARTRR